MGVHCPRPRQRPAGRAHAPIAYADTVANVALAFFAVLEFVATGGRQGSKPEAWAGNISRPPRLS